jgi:hypothetical protein
MGLEGTITVAKERWLPLVSEKKKFHGSMNIVRLSSLGLMLSKRAVVVKKTTMPRRKQQCKKVWCYDMREQQELPHDVPDCDTYLHKGSSIEDIACLRLVVLCSARCPTAYT